MSDHRHTLRGLFDELVELDGAAREARLSEIGAVDASLGDRLAALLAADAAEAGDATRGRDRIEAAAGSLVGERPPRAAHDPLGLLGATVGRYRVDDLLGAGGMGVVYRATDPRLNRVAALKFLPPAWMAAPTAKARLLHEARAASSLDHPNVCTIYEADETADGVPYIAMACYEGETLRDRLRRGPLAIGEAVDLALQTARGLAAAHARGLVHRDVKPANLLLSRAGPEAAGTRLKILDFGIAKAADAGLTLDGQRPGTAAYMAPEQARGEELDARADLWSLGIVFYEMLTGRRPAGRGPGEPPSAPSGLRPDVPEDVDALVLRLLAEDRESRPRSAAAVVRALERTTLRRSRRAGGGFAAFGRELKRRWLGDTPGVGLSRGAGYAGVGILVGMVVIGAYAYLHDAPAGARTSAAADAPRSLAVLPFANTGPAANDGFFADGVTDDILMHLAQVPEMSVISRTTMMRYKGSERSAPEIADELGVRYVLEGNVQRVDGRVRISARLVDAATDQPLWADSYDRELGDVFAVQSEIARSIVGALQIELTGGVAARLDRPPTLDVEAYDLFLLGRETLYRYDAASVERSAELFERALQRDPEFALARAWLARALALYAHNHAMGSAWADSAVAVARAAVAQQPDLSDAHTALGTARFARGSYPEAIASFERALELNPNDWIAAVNLGGVFAWLLRWDDAIRLTRHSLRLEPARSHSAYGNLSFYYVVLGLLEPAQAALERALAVGADDPQIVDNQAWVLLARGQHDAARESARRLVAMGDDDPLIALLAAQIFHFAGDPDAARDAAAAAYARAPTALRVHLVGTLCGYSLLQTGEAERGHRLLDATEHYAGREIAGGHEAAAFRYALAAVHAARGERDAAFHWLDEAIGSGWNLASLTRADPVFAGLHDDPRFAAALQRMERSLEPMRERVVREGGG